jgi:hypothetical protein
MKLQDFVQLRKRGLLLNERAMRPDNPNVHLQNEAIVWFVEFPDESWLRGDRYNYTKDPLNAARFLTEKETLLFIEYYKLDEFGAIATEHMFL